MPAARVLAVAPGSPAQQAGIATGDEIMAVNGEQLRDVIAYQLHADGARVDLEVRRGGLEQQLVVHKPEGAPLGLELAHAIFDRVQTCDNHCPFCFIHQLPKGMRRNLYLQDDDFRLSFLYGNFTTLTRFTEADFERIVTEKLSPLYVSIHATDPAVRTRLLRNPRGATSLRWLELLLAAGVEVHGQVVVCPGINDGAVLDDTLLGVLDRFSELATIGVVPLGVSAHSHEPEMRPHSRQEAAAVIDTIHAWQARFQRALGRRLVYASDEYYLLAGYPFPTLDAYDRVLQHENGIGMARTFEAEVGAALAGAEVSVTGTRSGFFAAVEGAPAEGYRAPRTAAIRNGASTPPSGAPRPIAIVTGELGAHVLAPLVPALGERAGVSVRLLPVENRFFGGNIGVTGLLTGADVAAALADQPDVDRYLLPDVVLSRGKFLDGETLAVLPRAVEVIGTDGAALVRALRPHDERAVMGTRELPRIAVVGRPNVGKSSLVNRIIGTRAAIVEEHPGVTRDRRELTAEWNGRAFVLVDTGGWLRPGESGLTAEPPALAAKVTAQAEAAMRAADLVLLVVDVTTGITEEDARVAKVLQRGDVPVMVVVNKVDAENREIDAHQFLRLGLGEPWVVSAIHGRASGELLDAVVAALPDPPEEHDTPAFDHTERDGIFSVAVVGRPNVGKSTLFNRLVGEERSVVHDLPGTTRDAIDTVVETEDGPLRFVDTAGLRRKSQIDEPSEYYSLVRALEAIDRADAALFLIDASEGVTNQDQRLAERVDAAGTAILLVLNKWDLLDTEQRAELRRQVGDKLGFLSYAPVLPISALTGRRVHHLLPALREAEAAYHARVPTAALNRILRDAQAAHPPPIVKKHRPRVLYATQGATDPPTFTLFTTRALPPQYLRYLERKLRENFDLGPTPIKLRVRRRDE